MFRSQLKFIITITLVLGLSISFQSLLAQWQAPTAGAPGNNIDKPINTGSFYQKKYGSLDVGGNLGVANDLTVLSDLTTGGTIFTDNLTSSTTGLNIDSGLYGMEFNIDSDGSGGDDFVYKVNGVAKMTVSSNGDVLAANNVYSNGEVLISANSVSNNYYSKTEVQNIVAALTIAAASSLDLYAGLHSSTQCTAIGGTVRTVGTDKYCEFNLSCSDGWILSSKYNKTAASTCTRRATFCGHPYNECTTGSHSTSQPYFVETCIYHECNPSVNDICYAAITERTAYCY